MIYCKNHGSRGVRSKPSQSGGRLLSPLFSDLHDLLQKPRAEGGQVQTVAEWRTIMSPSIFQPSFRIIKNGVREGSHQNGRRVANDYEALSFWALTFPVKKTWVEACQVKSAAE